ncbi:Short-chain collagen C4 [Holothuria leucospilota]|uniref:Short-chain collagen C4 n=1 Tax=Holothuria leucospilota TaxID=206669 RepID=A0A9Q1CL38_HOLLE|nr:Short-chain collagen C4 [Holothuria leucospilota]
MSVLQSSFLILLQIAVIFSVGDFQLGQNDKDKINYNEMNETENSLRYLEIESGKGRFHLGTKLRRSRRNVSEGAQMQGNFCPGCSGSYTPYYSGQCFLCPPGTPGPRGPPGQQGIPGRDGRDGRDGGYANSNPVDVSNAGPNRNSGVSGGSVYVRWGRNECPPLSELIYEGIAAGGHYAHKGSGSNYLCMPEEPIYDEPVAGSNSQSRGFLYGAEYETNTFANWNQLHNSNVHCAVCWAPSRASLLMIPARNICPGSEWTKEYSGYLVSAYYDHPGRTEFVCMDRNAEAVPRSNHNADGALFYPVESRCGSSGSGLLCGPYVDGYELTCAVCTR